MHSVALTKFFLLTHSLQLMSVISNYAEQVLSHLLFVIYTKKISLSFLTVTPRYTLLFLSLLTSEVTCSLLSLKSKSCATSLIKKGYCPTVPLTCRNLSCRPCHAGLYSDFIVRSTNRFHLMNGIFNKINIKLFFMNLLTRTYLVRLYI